MKLHGLDARYSASNSATILLENPVGKNVLNINSFTEEVSKNKNFVLIKYVMSHYITY